jgi:hypothetical protein
MTSVGKWTYPSGRYPSSASPRSSAARVVVQPFLDLRSARNQSAMVWAYIPLSPYGWMHFERPEAVVPGTLTIDYRAEPCGDLARSLVVELLRQRVVEQATYATDFAEDPAATHLLRGRVLSFYDRETRFCYGLSTVGQALWYVGLPMGTSSNGFCIELELLDRSDRRVVWRERIYDADQAVEGAFYGPEWMRFSWMWELRLREKFAGLAKALGAEPAPLPPELERELRASPLPRFPKDLGPDDPARSASTPP